MNYNTKEILDLFKGYDFPEDFSSLDFDDLESFMQNQIVCKCYTGASKFVIDPAGIDDYVIKIPYRGFGYKYYNDYVHSTCNHFSNFMAAEEDENLPVSPLSWDYCKLEASRFSIAEEAQLNKFFAKTIKIGETEDSYPIYIQEKCITFYDYDKTLPYATRGTRIRQSLQLVDNIMRNTPKLAKSIPNNLNYTWIADAGIRYGVRSLVDFLIFITDHQWICDLRECNIGYTKQGNKPVLIDYSGFYE